MSIMKRLLLILILLLPQLLAAQDFDLRICERLGLDPRERDMSEWNEFLRKQNHANHHADKVKIAVVGKYLSLIHI